MLQNPQRSCGWGVPKGGPPADGVHLFRKRAQRRRVGVQRPAEIAVLPVTLTSHGLAAGRRRLFRDIIILELAKLTAEAPAHTLA